MDLAGAAIVETYEGLRRAIADRRRALRWSALECDERTGLQVGYTSKLEAGVKNLGPLSFNLLFQALGLQVMLRVGEHQGQRLELQALADGLSKEKSARYGAMGGRACAANRTARQRQQAAAAAAKVRWSKARAKKIRDAERRRRAILREAAALRAAQAALADAGPGDALPAGEPIYAANSAANSAD